MFQQGFYNCCLCSYVFKCLKGKGQQIACAVCARVLVPALSAKILEFALVWDMPKIHFLLKNKDHIR